MVSISCKTGTATYSSGKIILNPSAATERVRGINSCGTPYNENCESRIEEVNSGQVSVITGDQPVYAIGKQVQWHYPDLYGEDKLVMMMGSLHIEMNFLGAIVDWL